ncbi:unnamed protein product [Cyprideis torosa]|uniref:Band 7 domain-containing protein n=1 Tax=Cyprideis torosa TaxID=163714 RepID=A0A7R8WE43_9CRUS|nr:unnamed protein product [Cyprideis torosa]CAG0889034.1 unnamed protein product [Cyprideis torosa]
MADPEDGPFPECRLNFLTSLPRWAIGLIVFLVLGLIVTIACLADSGHKIEEGHVGVYFVNGALRQTISHPGVHFMTPFVSRVEQVISSVDADKLIKIIRKFGPRFKEVLVFDRISEELRVFCANHTIDEVYNTMFLDIVGNVKSQVESNIFRLVEDGIRILNLVIPKPDIPSDIALNYKQVKVQWTEQLVATQQQKTERIRKETEKIKAVLDAERNKAVLEITIQENILQKEGEKNISLINNEIQAAKEKNIADMKFYTQQQAAKANKELYSPEYVKLELAKHLSHNTKLFFSGQESMLGSLFQNIFGKTGDSGAKQIAG